MKTLINDLKERSALEIAGAVVAVAFSLFHLYTSAFGLLTAVLQRTTHFTFAVVLLSLLQITGKRGKLNKFEVVTSWILMAACLFCCVYMFLNFKGFVQRAGAENTMDLIVAGVFLLIVLEMTRRATGWLLPTLALIALFYCLFGKYMPGMFAHKGVTIRRLVTYMSFGTEGILGTPLGVSATYVALFVIFGGFLNASGTGEFFIRFANSLVGRFRGGPAKVAVISSALMGMVSGSAAANVVGTGSLTIPLMKKTGYSDVFSGAVESAASTGGQLMPPVMGAAAFIMAEMVGVPYVQVAKAALIPSLLFFTAIFLSVDAEALRLKLHGIPSDQAEKPWHILKERGLLILPVLTLILALTVFSMTVTRSALISILVCLVVGFLQKKETRLTISKTLAALRESGEGLLQVAIVCACAGIIAGTLTLTGLGMKLGYILVNLSGGHLLPLLALTMVASIILGMGVPTTACFIIMATVVAPALIRANVPIMAAYLFVFYFGILSVVTPPVALAAYAASGISGADPMKTGFAAWRLSLTAWLIPFSFVYSQELLMTGTASGILLAVITGVISAYAMSGVATGFFHGNINLFQRLLLLLGAVLLIIVDLFSDLIGVGIIVLTILYQHFKNKSKKAETA